jgi:hypothetical protein
VITEEEMGVNTFGSYKTAGEDEKNSIYQYFPELHSKNTKTHRLEISFKLYFKTFCKSFMNSALTKNYDISKTHTLFPFKTHIKRKHKPLTVTYPKFTTTPIIQLKHVSLHKRMKWSLPSYRN